MIIEKMFFLKFTTMNKIIALLFFNLLLLSCSSVKQTRQSINEGSYDEAINIAIEKLQNNKSKKGNQPYILMLKEAFDKAVIRDNESITFLKKENNPERIEEIFNLYLNLSERQNIIKPLLPLRIIETNEEVKFDFVNYQEKVLDAKEKLVAFLYDKSSSNLRANNLSKMGYRRIYDNLNYIQKLSPNYKNVISLLNVCHKKGTDWVYVALRNKTNKVIPKRLEKDLLNFDTYNLNNFWTVYDVTRDRNKSYDYKLEFNFRNINISPERVNEKEIIKEREIEEITYIKDSLGRKIESVNIVNASCTIYQITQSKTCDIRGNVNIIDLKNNNQIIENFPLNSGYVFTNIYGNFRGDRRVLDEDFNQIINNDQVPFPSNEQMIYDTGKDLKNKLRRILMKSNFR